METDRLELVSSIRRTMTLTAGLFEPWLLDITSKIFNDTERDADFIEIVSKFSARVNLTSMINLEEVAG